MPSIRTLAVTCVALALGLSACGGDPAAPREEIGTIEYARSGGIAGVSEKLRIEPSGEAEVTAGRDAEQAQFTLTEGERADLRRVLEENPLDSLPEVRAETECRDCFSYTASYGGASYGGDDTTLPDEADPVFSALEQVLIDNLGPRGPDGRLRGLDDR